MYDEIKSHHKQKLATAADIAVLLLRLLLCSMLCYVLRLFKLGLTILLGADLPLPDTIKLDFRQIQSTHFTAIRSKGKKITDQKI